MKKVSVIGKFISTEMVTADGQSVKTRIVTQELEKALGTENVHRIDTYGWKKKPFQLLKNSFLAVRHSDNVVFMTDEGGIKVFPWLLRLSNVFGKCSLHYVVIGGWLVHFLENHRFLRGCLKRFDSILVETTIIKNGLERLGFQNIHLMPNFKSLSPLSEDCLCRTVEEPFKFCVFSRIMKEKGIEEAVNAIREVNDHYGRSMCTLDIYGQVDPGQAVWFENLSASFPDYVRYCGVVPFTESVDVLKEYYALLFPTKFYTEGIPGTIIDAYAAGVPVIAAEWESFADVVDHGFTGIGYPFSKPEALTEILVDAVSCPGQLDSMRKNCLKKAEQYLPNAVIGTLLSVLS